MNVPYSSSMLRMFCLLTWKYLLFSLNVLCYRKKLETDSFSASQPSTGKYIPGFPKPKSLAYLDISSPKTQVLVMRNPSFGG